MTEADNIDISIEHAKNKLDTVKRVKELVDKLEQQGKVIVDNPEDSYEIFIRVELDEPTESLKELAEIQSISDDIVYNYEDETYILEKRYREK